MSLLPEWNLRPIVDALQAMRGIALINAVVLVAEVGDFTRFANPRQLMAYFGLVPGEQSSGETVRRGGITKAGNSHARRALVEGAWAEMRGDCPGLNARGCKNSARAIACGMISKLLHQLWRDADLPERFRGFREGWLRHHPDWTYRLWTDADTLAFVQAAEPDLLPVFAGHSRAICRADIARYLILKHEGGLYIDLDFECLRPLDPILEGTSLAIGLEPASHSFLEDARDRGLTQILCPSLIASAPGHVFWDAVLEELVTRREEPDVLDATGPYLLTRAYERLAAAGPAGNITLLSDTAIYPFDKFECWNGRLFDIEFWERATREAYAVHHWEGSWFRRAPRAPRKVKVSLTGPASAVTPVQVAPTPDPPLVSCLMTTRDRPEQAALAVGCFRAQTYPARELVIVDDSADDRLARAVASDSRIRYIQGGDPAPILGRARNRAVAAARGDYVCQWDDDDLYDPLRIEMQLAAIQSAGAQACLLQRWTMWWSDEERLAISGRRPWEGSLLCERALLPTYPELPRGEDTPVVAGLLQQVRVVHLDEPRLYVYVVHGHNTFAGGHFDAHWAVAEHRYTGRRGRAVLAELGKRLPVDAYRRAVSQRATKGWQDEAGAAAGRASDTIMHAVPGASGERVIINPRRGDRRTAKPDQLRVGGSVNELPPVLVLTPARNAAHSLDPYFEALERLEYPADRIRFAFLEGDSSDNTFALLAAHVHRLAQAGTNVRVFRKDFGRNYAGPRWTPDVQLHRRSGIAKARNWLLNAALAGEQWVLWIDADVIDFPPNALQQLLGAKRDVVVPHCVLAPGGPTFDLNTFQNASDDVQSDASTTTRGLFQPARGEGRRYLESFRGQELVRIDSVGGTMLLVRADLHREGLVFPATPINGLIETEAFALLVREAGYQCWGMPDLEIIHASF